MLDASEKPHEQTLLERIGSRVARLSIRFRWPILILTAAGVLAAGTTAFRIDYEITPEIWFLDSDPARIAYERFLDRFGSDNVLVITCEVEEGTVFQNETLESIERLCQNLDDVPNVARVLSLTRHETFRGEGDDLIIENPLGRLPLAETELRRAEAEILSDRQAAAVVRNGGRTAVVIAETEPMPSGIELRVDLVRRIRECIALEDGRTGLLFHLLGQNVLDEDLYQKTRRDMRFTGPLILVVVGLLLGLTLRGWTGLTLPLFIAVSAVILTRIIQHALGWKDSSLVGLVPGVVLVVGIADSVHIVIHYLTLRGNGWQGAKAAEETVRVLFTPCLLTSFTTMVGFLALLTASLAPLRQFGTLAAAGTGIAFVLSVVVLPAALSLIRGDFAVYKTRFQNSLLNRFVGQIPRWVERDHRVIPWVGIGITILGLAGFARLSTESDYLDIFRPNDPLRTTTEAMEEAAGGLLSLEILVHGNDDGAVLRPEVLQAIDGLGAVLESDPLVTGVYSVADLLKSMNRAMHGDDPAFERVPESARLAAQYLLLLEASSSDVVLDRMLDLPRRHARIWVRTLIGSSKEYRGLQRRAESYAQDHFPPDIDVEQTGYVILHKNMEDYVIRSQIRSFLLALVFITLIMIATFRSWKIGLFSLIPNVWPIALTLGIMGWIGISLNPATAMVAAVVLGIAVDDTVHFLHKFLEGRARGQTTIEAMNHAFSVSGRAILFTTVILMSGFMVISLATLKLFMDFGTLCMIAVFLALLADLFLLPAMLLRARSAA